MFWFHISSLVATIFVFHHFLTTGVGHVQARGVLSRDEHKDVGTPLHRGARAPATVPWLLLCPARLQDPRLRGCWWVYVFEMMESLLLQFSLSFHCSGNGAMAEVPTIVEAVREKLRMETPRPL